MKFLGEYSSEAADIYQDKLKDEDIFPTSEEVGGHFACCWATMGSLRPRVRLYVEDNEYDQAVGLIKDLEQNFEMKVKIDGKAADKVMIKIVLGILFLIGLSMFFVYIRG